MYKVETNRVQPAFLVASLPSIFIITALSLARSNVGKYNQVQLQSRTRAELCKQIKLKRERKSFWVFQSLNESKRKEKSFCCFCKLRGNKEEHAKTSKI